MKILCISDAWHPQINGVVRTYENIGQVLGTMGHEFHVIGPADFKMTMPMPTYPDIRLAIFARWTLPRMIDTFQPDCIHIATEGPLGWAARRYCQRKGLSFTTSYHSRFPEFVEARVRCFAPFLAEPVRRGVVALLRWFHSPAARIMVSTQSLATDLRAQDYASPLHFFTRGVDTDVFHPGDVSEFRSLKRPVALYVGRVAIEKNLEAFLSAPWHGSKVVTGDGPALAELQKRYPDAVFTGARTGSGLADCYRSADVFAFPSRSDTFGIVLLEALACGLPVTAFPVHGPMDVITSPLLGALNGDFGTALKCALSAPGSREDRFEFVRQNYTWEKAAQQFLDGLAASAK